MSTLSTVEPYRPCLQTVSIAFFVVLHFVVNRVGAQAGRYVLYLPFSYEGGILFYNDNMEKRRLLSGAETCFLSGQRAFAKGYPSKNGMLLYTSPLTI